MRRILLDTHVFLWMQFESKKLSANLTDLLKRDEVSWHFSQVSLLEIQIKYDLGKFSLPEAPGGWLVELVEKSGLAYHPLNNEAIFMLGKLPDIHRDPFDRLLVATALTEGWEIATVDEQIEKYPVRTVC